MARDRYKVTRDQEPHFVTCTVVNWLPVFTRPGAVKIVLDSLQHLQAAHDLTLFGYVIMENHHHLVASGGRLSKTLGRFKSFTARKIIDFLIERGERGMLRELSRSKMPHKTDREFQLWQEGSHPVLIQGEEMMRQKVDYMHSNPVRRGYVDDPVHWRYSSARNYVGMEGLLEVCVDW